MRVQLFLVALTFATALGCHRPAHAGDTSPTPEELERLRHKNRVVLVFTPTPDDARLEAQWTLWRGREAGFADRDLVVLEGPSSTSALARTYAIPPGAFAVLLVGKDGHTAYRTEVPVTAEDLFQRIDAMPMRRDEMRERGR